MNFNANFETQEPKVGSQKTKIILLSLAAIFIICGVLMAIFHPEAEFTWLFGEIKYFLGLFIIAAFLFLMLLYNLGETRDEKYYFTPDGKLDLSTPRYYTKLKRHKLFELITKKGNVDEFAYDGEGNIYIKFRKGEELVAPLEDLTVSYTMDKNQFSDDWYVAKMKITTPEGAEYKVKWGPEIEDAEFEDIFMILSTAGTLKESNISKATKWMSKLKDSVEGFDFSNLVGSGIAAGTDLAASALGTKKSADNSVISLIKTKVYEDKKKKSWFKKSMEYFWLTVGILFIVIVLIVNIAALPEIFGGVDKEYDEYIQGLEEENLNHSEGEAIPTEVGVSGGPSTEFLENAGYEYFICSFDDNNNPFYLSIFPETGEGVYQAPSGNLYYLTIEEENDTRTQFFCTATDSDGNSTKLTFYANTEHYPDINGKMVGTDGNSVFDFTGSLKEISE